MIRSFLTSLLVLVLFMALCVGGWAAARAAGSAWRAHERPDDPRLEHVACWWHQNRVTVSGTVINPNDGRHFVAVMPEYRLADGVLRGGRVVRGGPVDGHAELSWRLTSSPAGPKQRGLGIKSCTPLAYIDDED